MKLTGFSNHRATSSSRNLGELENRVYRKRYRDDVKITGELGTITVREETGRILHLGHHFTRQEIYSLLKGFNIISLEKDVFTSYYHRNWVKGYIILAQKTG